MRALTRQRFLSKRPLGWGLPQGGVCSVVVMMRLLCTFWFSVTSLDHFGEFFLASIITWSSLMTPCLLNMLLIGYPFKNEKEILWTSSSKASFSSFGMSGITIFFKIESWNSLNSQIVINIHLYLGVNSLPLFLITILHLLQHIGIVLCNSHGICSPFVISFYQ